MDRNIYFDYIFDKLGALAYKIELKGKLNLLELHNHSENFWQHFLNKVMNWKLDDANKLKQNVEAIDLVDKVNLILCQISATCNKQKLENSLNKDLIRAHRNFTFKFVSISKDASELRRQTFNNPYNIAFNPSTDIIDLQSVLNEIKRLTAAEQKPIYEFIKSELGGDIDIVKFDSNLAIIINILSKVTFDPNTRITVNTFEIDRKISYNALLASKRIIDECKPYYAKVDKKYTEFNRLGSNKSASVFSAINTCLTEAQTQSPASSNDSMFLKVIEKVINIIINSANYISMPIDELELCVKVLVVDAFVRCKIFGNPENYQYASS